MDHPPQTAPDVVVIENLSKSYAGRQIFDKANMRLSAGERVALIGESGAGKSSLLNIIAGLEPADSGSIRVLGSVIDTASPDHSASLRRHHIGFVFQAFHLLPHLRVWQNIALPLILLHGKARETRERVQQLLERIGLGARAMAWPSELSGGEQQRVALARALIHRPALILADEPTGNLDPATAAQALLVMNDLVQESQSALLMVTHSTQAAQMADRVLRIQHQRLA